MKRLFWRGLCAVVCSITGFVDECRGELLVTDVQINASAVGRLGSEDNQAITTLDDFGRAFATVQIHTPDPFQRRSLFLDSTHSSSLSDGGFLGSSLLSLELVKQTSDFALVHLGASTMIEFTVSEPSEYWFDASVVITEPVLPGTEVSFELLRGRVKPIDLTFESAGESQIHERLVLEAGNYRFLATHFVDGVPAASINGSSSLTFAVRNASVPEPSALMLLAIAIMLMPAIKVLK